MSLSWQIIGQSKHKVPKVWAYFTWLQPLQPFNDTVNILYRCFFAVSREVFTPSSSSSQSDSPSCYHAQPEQFNLSTGAVAIQNSFMGLDLKAKKLDQSRTAGYERSLWTGGTQETCQRQQLQLSLCYLHTVVTCKDQEKDKLSNVTLPVKYWKGSQHLI